MPAMSKILSYILFIGFVVGAGLIAGLTNMPGDWYQSLQKPFFNPPSWIFGPVWTTLYVMIGVAGARIWQRAPKSAAMQLWFAQMAFNLMWSPAFFGLQNPELALVVIIGMLAPIGGFMLRKSWRHRPHGGAALPALPRLGRLRDRAESAQSSALN